MVPWQGETMEQQFGEKEVCFRTLDLYTSAVLEASLNPAATPKQEYRDAMAQMSEVGSCNTAHARADVTCDLELLSANEGVVCNGKAWHGD